MEHSAGFLLEKKSTPTNEYEKDKLISMNIHK